MFVVGSLTIGGIETYITRLSFLLKKEYNLYILNLSSKVDLALENQLLQNVVIINFKEISIFKQFSKCNLSAINHSLSIDFKKLNKLVNSIDIIHCVDSETNIVGVEISKYYDSKLTTSSYHPMEYVWDNNFYFRKIQKNIIKNIYTSNIYYMNEAVKEATLNSLMITDKTNNIIPLGVNIDKYYQCKPDFKSNKIISVGRLTHFKTYNELMIKNIDRINKQYNKNFEYHIYGDGVLKDRLRALAKKQTSKIVFHGTVNYDRLPEIFSDAFVFIGVGTSIIESSAAGLPTVIGTGDFKKELVYGLFCEYDNYLVGEECSDCTLSSLVDIFGDLCKMSKEDYYSLSNKHKSRAAGFNIKNIIKILISFFENSSNDDMSIKYSKIYYFISNTIWLISNKLKLLNDREYRYFSLRRK